MVIKRLEKSDSKEIISLWNNSINDCFIYRRLDEELYRSYFFRENDLYEIISYKAIINNKIVGFISGVKFNSRNTFYITMILVDKNFRKQKIGTKLFEELEKEYKDDENIKKIDLMFTNPVNLIWNVPFTKLHEHPNAPGVDLKGDGYLFFKNMGFRDIAYQNSYYRTIQDYEYSEEVKKRLKNLKDEGITADFYNINKHTELKELMKDLNSAPWEEEILGHVKEKQENNTLLVALDGNKVIGFTGPIHLQKSGRGYFAGIGIHSEYRGRGIGTLLFTKLCMSFKEIDVIYATLFTGKNNPARNIYEKEGFKIVRSWANMRKELRK